MGSYQNYRLIQECNKLRLDISRALYVELSDKWKYHKNSSAYFTRIYFVTEGEADILCNHTPYKLLPNNIYIIPAGTPFSYDCPKRLCKLYFQVNLFGGLGEDIPIAPKGCIVFENRAEDVRKMLELFHQSDYVAALSIHRMLEEILCAAMQRSDQSLCIPQYSSPIRKILRIMTDAPSMAMTVAKMAETVHLSHSVFQKRFKHELGISPIKYLRQRVIAAAERDLKANELTLQEISDKYGFCDQFHFSRAFTAWVGIPPSRYRKDRIM